jgi:hypothetical protein
MIAVFITFRYGEDFSATKVRRMAENSRAKFEGMPGLRSKLFSVLPDTREARNVYIWANPEAARTFLTPENLERIAGLYGVQPVVEYAEVCTLVENATSAWEKRCTRL